MVNDGLDQPDPALPAFSGRTAPLEVKDTGLMPRPALSLKEAIQRALDQRPVVEAARKVVREVPQIKFLLIGDGPKRKELEQQVAEYGLSENIIFPGYQKEIHNHLKTLDIFVLSSLWEGFSIALLEALALELPIVATDVGGNSEIVNNNVTGMLVPSKDPPALKKALLTLYGDQNLRQTFARNGREHFVKNCTVLTMVEKYHRLYERLMNIKK